MNTSSNLTQISAEREKFFVEIWKEYQVRLRSFCLRRMSGDSYLVDDVMSLTAEKAFKYITTTNVTIDNPLAWLCTMSRNICTDIHRVEAKNRALVNEVDASPDTYFFAANQSDLLETAIEYESDLAALIHNITSLSKEQKELFMLRIFHGMAYHEISKITHMPVVNLRKRMQLLRSDLRECIAH